MDSVKLFVLITLVYSKLMRVLFIQIIKFCFRCVLLTDGSPKLWKIVWIANRKIKFGRESCERLCEFANREIEIWN